MFSRLFAWIGKYERHLSAAAMFAGFVVDNIFLNRIDVATTHVVFLGYTLVCLVSISWLHFLESRAPEGSPRSRLLMLLPLATQFALGGFWSGLLIFYGRGAVIAASWPFLLLLILIGIGNEVFRKYHDRLVFTSVLFFFALYSYIIFAVPIVTHTLGTFTFLLSSTLAVIAFWLFTRLLRLVGRERFFSDVWPIRLGAFAVLVVMQVFYFTHLLPPLPLTLQSGGIYHSVTRSGTTYIATGEHQSWLVGLGASAVIRTTPYEPLYAYSAVFAPTKLTTTIVHRWQRYDPQRQMWITASTIPFAISGGRDGGYRGYSIKENPTAGKWRVDVETGEGHLIGRIRFSVQSTDAPVERVQKILE